MELIQVVSLALIVTLVILSWFHFKAKNEIDDLTDDNKGLEKDIRNQDKIIINLKKDLGTLKGELRKIRETKVKIVPVTPKEAFPKNDAEVKPKPVKKVRKPKAKKE